MRFLSISLISVLSLSAFIHTKAQTVTLPSQNFYDVQKKFYEEFKDKVPMKDGDKITEDGIYQHFKRWEWFMEPRVFPTGVFPDELIYFNEYHQYQKTHPAYNLRTQGANWTPLGPSVIPANGGNLGRINCLTFDPTNSNIIYLGSACGGLWKSTDGGISWTSNTDLLSVLSISDMAINPFNTNIMYIATGDKYGIYSSYETTGHYSAGVLKSIDGGATWNPTGLTYTQYQGLILQRLILNPVNPNVLMAANKYGIFRSSDAGQTWVNVKSGYFYDLAFNPLNPDVVYACSSYGAFRSNDGGLTWVTLSAVLGTSGRHTIGISPADTSIVYVWCNGSQLYRSASSGTNFTLVTSPSSSTTPYGYYDNVLAVSPVNANFLIAGGLKTAKSSDGGNTWITISNPNGWPTSKYVHADNHDIEFLPGSGTTIFSLNDGGIFRSTDTGNSWYDLSNGIPITQFYRFANAKQDPYLIYAGAQDNGTDRFDGSSWARVFGADGMEAMIDYTNANNVYVSYQGGALQKSTDGGITFNDISPSYGYWVTPFVMHPTNPQILFAGYGDVYKSIDGGLNWNKISSVLPSGSYIDALALAPSNPNYIYFSSANRIFRTTNGGTNWGEITTGLPGYAITYIAISPTDPDRIWVTLSGYSAGNKVFRTTNGGTSWVNVSGTLPNLPANCIVYENLSNDGLYIGTDMGVFYTDANLNDWVSYNTGLPNVIIDELEIQYSVSKLRAATYGRGIWETDLFNGTVGIKTAPGKEITLYPNPSPGIFNLSLKNMNEEHVNIKVYDAIGNVVKELNTENLGSEKRIEIDLSTAANGVYFLKAQGNNFSYSEKVFVMKGK